MPDAPWLTIIGVGEDGAEGLTNSSKLALDAATSVLGSTRHIGLFPEYTTKTIAWPTPFSDGLPILMERRGRPTVLLVSGDPFWFGAGSVVTRDLAPGEWRAIPHLSVPGLFAARLGWPLEKTATFGLHAAPFTRLRPHLSQGARLIATLRDGQATKSLAGWLADIGFGATLIHVGEALGGPRERLRSTTAADFALTDIAHPVAVALEIAGHGASLPLAAGRADKFFDNDGQITKRPIRALTLSALAPRPGERLWDIGGGSGSIAIEWLLAHSSCEAISIEKDAARAERIRGNAAALGQDRLLVIEGAAPDALTDLPPPDAIFIGGGLSDALLETLASQTWSGARLVANAVTLESEALLATWQGRKGGDLTRIEISDAAPLGPRRGWKASYPIVQWSVTL